MIYYVYQSNGYTSSENEDTANINQSAVKRVPFHEGKTRGELMKKVIVAKLTKDGKTYVGKREVKLYDESSKMDAQAIAHANVGLTLATQSSIRNAVAVKYGLKAVTTGGVAVDLSAVESI
jgi:hypothetical protein